MTEIRIGLLACDHVSPEDLEVAGDYPAMFSSLFAHRPEVLWRCYDLRSGEVPVDLDECDAWMTTGSRRSVYERQPWIEELAKLVRTLHRRRRRFVGICFGAQMIAHALGGTVARAAQGWGVGVKRVQIVRTEPWMRPAAAAYRVINSHADQILQLPDGGRLLGGNEHCPISMLAVGDHMLGFQGHPEFEAPYARKRMEYRRGRAIPSDIVDAGVASLVEEPDRRLLADWMVEFLTR